MKEKVLYGLDKKGKVKIWKIFAEGNQLFISHGALNGKLQTKQETVEPTNVGRANERNGTEQAEFEANSRYKKQIDKGYRPTTEELTELPLLPMLAQDFHEHGHKIEWPCFGSCKLDGLRCLMIREEDRIIFRSRGNKEYFVPHIDAELRAIMPVGAKWDGELYIHGLFLEEITSAVKKPNENTPNLEFYIFDVVTDEPYFQRSLQLKELAEVCDTTEHIRVVKDHLLHTQEQAKELHDHYKRQGYEGLMIRARFGLYESGKRSNALQKYKEFVDEEFEVVAVEEDRNGNGVLVLYCPVANATFGCTYGDFDERKRQLEHPSDYIGRDLTVEYQKRYKDSKLPQFPTGKCFREE